MLYSYVGRLRFTYEITDIEQLGRRKWKEKKMSLTDDWSEMFCGINHPSSLLSIEEQGFHIGIGVATCADSIYISPKLKDIIEEDRLLPAINAPDLTGDKLNWNGEYLQNPFDEKGNLVDLIFYPKTLSYLESKKEILANRHIAKKSPDKWYRTIDKVKAELQNTLKILCSILMSDFVKKQIQEQSNNMNGGYARWQSQNLRKLRIPYIKGITQEQAALLEAGYDKKDLKLINDCVTSMINRMPIIKLAKAPKKPIQLSLTFS